MTFRFPCVFLAIWVVFAAECLSAADIAPYRFQVECGKPDVFVPYAATQPIDRSNEKVDRVVVGIHSSGFDAVKCLAALRQAAARVKHATDTTLIVAPQFFDVGSIKQPIPSGLLAWKVSPYRGSSLACVGPQKEDIGVSSHIVLNQLLSNVADLVRFPNLKTIVVCGHSSGGQMAQRYAITSKFKPPKGIAVRFVASGASSYAYLNAKRPRQGSPVTFEVLDGDLLNKYPNYNKWGYGLEDRYRAFRRASDDYLRNRYASRRVLYLCGSKDDDPNDSSLSKVPGAMLQGRNRLERMRLFYAHLIDVYGEDISKKHSMAIARGVNHNGFDAYSSREGQKFLFDYAPIDRDKDGTTDWEEWLSGSE